jgi:hypothetical protein
MSWLRIDDGFTEHRKLVGLKRSQRWTWLEVLTYCARSGNGSIPRGISDVLKHVTPPFLKRCVDLGLIDETEHGMEVHDWDLYNPKDPLKAERQARWRANQASTRASTRPSTETERVDDSGVYKNVYGDGAPSPTPPPAPNGSSTVSSTPSLPTVVPGPVEGISEQEEDPVDPRVVLEHIDDVLKDIPW